MNFPTVNRKIRKKNVMWAFIYFINEGVTLALAIKYRKLTNEVKTIAKISFKKENTLYISFPSALLTYGIK